MERVMKHIGFVRYSKNRKQSERRQNELANILSDTAALSVLPDRTQVAGVAQ